MNERCDLKSEVLHNKELQVAVKVIAAVIKLHLLTALERCSLRTIPPVDVIEKLLRVSLTRVR